MVFQAPSIAIAAPTDEAEEAVAGAPGTMIRELAREHVSLRGTTRGLEILITGTPQAATLGARLSELLAEAPSFFAGSDARVVFENPLPPGALACLEEVATRFELRIVEINPLVLRRRRSEPPRAPRTEELPAAEIPPPHAPGAVAPAAAPPSDPSSAAPASVFTNSAPIPAAVAEALADVGGGAPPTSRLVVGPVRSGTIVDHAGHLVVIGDVNPGAEIRAEGSIIVLGRLRGVAHAAIGRERGFIVALSLQPQQLRIGRMVARAADADRPSSGAEIAYAAGETIVVERFLGRLPSGLAASM